MSEQDEAGSGQPQVTPRSSLGSGALSYSSSSISPSPSSSGSNSAKSAVSECLGAWLNYLQIMNSLCASGYRLAQTISTLEQWEQQQVQPNPAFQFNTAWDDLARATAVATSTVKSHIVTVLQDYITQPLNTLEQDTELHRVKEHNSTIVTEITQLMINLQHQFCVASYDSFSPLICCFMCHTPVGFTHDQDCTVPQQSKFPQSGGSNEPSRSRTTSPPQFGSTALIPSQGRTLFGSSHSDHHSSLEQPRGSSPHQDNIRGPSPIQGFLDNIRGPLPNPGHLLGMKMPFYRGSRSPLNFPLFPLLNGQRRWSEAAAGEVSGADYSVSDAENQMRRWSMPWEATKTTDRNTVSWNQTGGNRMPISKLAVHKSSQSTTPDSIWSQDGLAEAIQLLSCRPARYYHPPHSTFIEESSTVSFCLVWFCYQKVKC